MGRAAIADALDSGSVDEILIRWKLAEQYVGELELDYLPSEQALRLLIRRDFPKLIQELRRLRPELS